VGGRSRPHRRWTCGRRQRIPDARVVDLFSGSGALGLEALSRGAAFVDFVENDARTFTFLQKNIATLGAADRCAIHRADAMTFSIPDPCDLCFADPPYRMGFAKTLADRWIALPFSTIFAVEHESPESMPAGGDTRKYGGTAITLYGT
jgi:16S rRNA (guanine966-N2)-methyltransferase